MRTHRGSSSVLAVISSRSSSSHSCCASTKSIPCFSRLALLFEASNSKFSIGIKIIPIWISLSIKDSIGQTRLSSAVARPLGDPCAHLAWRLHSLVTSPHESCAPAAPRWVPFLLVRSRNSMPAIGVGVERERKRIKDRKLSSPAESHRQALPEPDVNLSVHPAPVVQPLTPTSNAQTGQAVGRISATPIAMLAPCAHGVVCISVAPIAREHHPACARRDGVPKREIVRSNEPNPSPRAGSTGRALPPRDRYDAAAASDAFSAASPSPLSR